MFPFFHHNTNSLKINPELLKYLNEYTKNHLEQICETQKFALMHVSPNPDIPEIKNLTLLMAVSLISFLAGLCFSTNSFEKI
jgi:hypothetical protein